MAGTTDKLLSVGNRGTLTTLAAPGKPVGASSLKIVQPLNWPTDSKVTFSIWSVYQGGDNDGKEIPGTYTEWSGILNAVDGSIDSLNLEQGTDQYYAPGGNTRVAIHISVTWAKYLLLALRGIMNLDGSLKKASLEDTLQLKTSELFPDRVVPNTGTVAVSSGLTCTISDITYYISGIRYTKTGIPNKTFTASKDTYGFIDTANTITWTEVANGAAAPATPVDSVRYVLVSTGASAVRYISLQSRGSTNLAVQNDFATAIFTNSTITGGQVISSGTSGVAYDKFEPSSNCSMSLASAGGIRLSVAGRYKITVNTRIISSINPILHQIAYSTDNGTTVSELSTWAPWAHATMATTDRMLPSLSVTAPLSAGTIVYHRVDLSTGSSRLGGGPASQTYSLSLNVERLS